MAQITDKQSYKDDVYRFLNRAINDVHTTPNGLTWQSQWGANRYAGRWQYESTTTCSFLWISNAENNNFFSFVKQILPLLPLLRPKWSGTTRTRAGTSITHSVKLTTCSAKARAVVLWLGLETIHQEALITAPGKMASDADFNRTKQFRFEYRL